MGVGPLYGKPMNGDITGARGERRGVTENLKRRQNTVHFVKIGEESRPQNVRPKLMRREGKTSSIEGKHMSARQTMHD